MSDYQEQIIADYQKLIYDIYQKEKLTSLKGLNNEFLVNGRNIVEWHAVITRKGRCKYYKSFDFIQNFDDLVLCSDEIMYFIANMYLYRPYMNSPIDDGLPFAGKMLYPNYENLPAYRYSMFADVVSQKLYNYWDRIGDLIAAYFPDLLKPHQVYFPKIIDVIPVQYHNEYYFWLREFKDFDYKIINQRE